MKERPPRPEPDELLTPEVGSWADDKYAIVWLYNTLFSSGMKKRFFWRFGKNLLFVLLFA